MSDERDHWLIRLLLGVTLASISLAIAGMVYTGVAKGLEAALWASLSVVSAIFFWATSVRSQYLELALVVVVFAVMLALARLGVI